MFAVFVPVVNLHFYLVFPRPNPILLRHRRWVIGAIYGISTAYLLALWGSMRAAGWLSLHGDSRTTAAFGLVRGLAIGYVALAVVIFGFCVASLVYSYRNAATRDERNQVQWILLAAIVASFLIAYLLGQAWNDPATLGRDNAAWPMFGVSLLFTMAHAFSITRYKLMEVEDLIDRSMVYFAFSLVAGLIYSVMLLIGGKLIGDRLFSTNPTTGGALVGGLLGDRGADPLRGGTRAVPEGDRPAVLPGEIQVRRGHAQDAAGRGEPGRSGHIRTPAPRGGG